MAEITTDLAARFEAKREECGDALLYSALGKIGFQIGIADNLADKLIWEASAQAIRQAILAAPEARDMARADAAGGAERKPVAWAFEYHVPNGEGTWEHRVEFDEPREGHWLRNVRPLFETHPPAQRGSSSPPLTAERVDLVALSDAASQGEWSVERMENHGTSPADRFFSYGIECGPHTILDTLNNTGGMLEQEHDEDSTTVWDEQARRDLTYIAALVNAHRSGHLVPASLPGGTGSADEGTDLGASSGPDHSAEPEPASGPGPTGECPSRGPAATVEQAAVIRDALIQARGALHIDSMTDEAGKPYGTTTVAQEAIGAALAILDAAPNRESDR